jgi:hypothetical protein
MARDHLTLIIVVNGEPAEVQANPEAPLHTVLPVALERTGNLGQPPENWELRDAGGTLLDVGREIDSFDFKEHTKLFLNLKAGIGG